ncbi:peroxidase, partial [Oryctes borbonicus]
THSTVEELLLGMVSQLAEREDSVLCSDVRDKLFGPMEFTRRDLGALNIMRGRDNGLPDYNTIRSHFKLHKIKNWEDINPELFKRRPDILANLKKHYKDDLNNIDVYVGGMLESYGGPGELFRTSIIDQFARIRDADRFWFENVDNGIFTEEEIEEIRRIKLYDVIVNCTNIREGHLQKNVFFWVTGDVCPQPEQLNASSLKPCNYLKGYDYFEGNEVVYIYSCVFLGFVPILCAGAGYGVVKLQNRRRRRLKIKQEEL